MIVIRMTYYPPTASPNEPSSLERTITVLELVRSEAQCVPYAATKLFDTLVANCEELGRELGQ